MINNAAKLQNKIYYANKIAKIFITDIVLKRDCYLSYIIL